MGGFLKNLADITGDVWDAFWQGLNFWQHLQVVGCFVFQGAADAGSAGFAQDIADVVGAFSLTWSAMSFTYDVSSSWQAYESG